MPFRFKLLWLEFPGFKEKVIEWWILFQFEGSAGFWAKVKGVEIKNKDLE